MGTSREKEETMEPFRQHVFVCTQEKPEGVKSCSAACSGKMLAALHRELEKQGAAGEVQVTTCGCLGLCDEGPIVIVYPEGVWYRGVKAADVPGIVGSHLRSGKPVGRLVWNDASAMRALITEHGEQYRAMLKAKEEAGVLPDETNELIRGFMSSRAVLTALELDVFSAIDDGASADVVAEKVHASRRGTEMLLNALAALKLLRKENGIFCNTPLSARFFADSSPDSARKALLHTANLWQRWTNLTGSVRTGTPAPRTGDGGWANTFIAAMDHNARARSQAVVNAVGAEGIRRILDLGGGSAAYSIAFARANPAVTAEVLDLADVIPLTREYIQTAGLSGRIQARVGDMLSDPLGDGFDLVLLSAICHMFSPEENRALYRRAHAALACGGRLLVHDFILEPEKTAPRFAALFSLNMLVGTRAGSSYSEPEYAAWLAEAGFRDVRHVRLPGPAGLLLATRD
jgi:(2Fe-2S) ferredoxin/SAM-dependent methyltransferase